MEMVKIEIEVPEWAVGRHISIMAGVELLAQMEFRIEKIKNSDGSVTRKRYYLPMGIKPNNGRCEGCGDCCNSGGPQQLQLIYETIKEKGYDPKTPCPMLDPKEGCTLGTSIPFSCASSNCEGWSDNCTEKFISVNDDIIVLVVV